MAKKKTAATYELVRQLATAPAIREDQAGNDLWVLFAPKVGGVAMLVPTGEPFDETKAGVHVGHMFAAGAEQVMVCKVERRLVVRDTCVLVDDPNVGVQ